jgi:hypothetical protein
MRLSLMNILGLSTRVRVALLAWYWHFFLLHYIQIICQYRLCKADDAYPTYLILQRQLNHLNGLSLTTAKFKPLIFCVWLRLVPYHEHVHSHDSV